MNCRVIYRGDGSVVVIHPAPKAQMLGETEDDFLKRVFGKAVKDTELEGLPCDDVDPSALPERKHRNKWRGSKGKGVRVDHSVVTVAERRQAVEDELDAELAKETPDSVHALKLQRKLQKKDY